MLYPLHSRFINETCGGPLVPVAALGERARKRTGIYCVACGEFITPPALNCSDPVYRARHENDVAIFVQAESAYAEEAAVS